MNRGSDCPGALPRRAQDCAVEKTGTCRPLYTRRKNDAADGVLPIRHRGDGAYAHASLVIRHGVMEVMVLDIAMSFVRPCRSTQIHAYHRYPNLEGVLYKLICCEKTCTRKKRKLAQDRSRVRFPHTSAFTIQRHATHSAPTNGRREL